MNPFDPITPELAQPDHKAPTESEIRTFRKQFITRILPTVATCGHKLDPEVPPSRNCIDCWFCYFNSNSERVQVWAGMLTEPNGEEELVKFYGSKYVKRFKQFLVAIDSVRKHDK
jgi:hypothetical protein